ncbi:MAG: leucine-rich repeat domain-containing protein, partial [Pseudomonadota bacterium]
PLHCLSGLPVLLLYSSQVSDLSTLSGLSGLLTLLLNSTQVSDLSPLQSLSGLQVLWLNSTQVSDLSPLQGMSELRELYLSHTQVSDLSPLQGLSALQRLYLEDTQVSDLSPIQGMSGLQGLSLSHMPFSDLSALRDLNDLQVLSLQGSTAADLSPLSLLGDLRLLNLQESRVADLLPLAGLSKLGDMPKPNPHRIVTFGLWFDDTPAANQDATHQALAAIERPQDRAKQVLQYLNGEHPEFGGPPEPFVSPKPPPIDWSKQDPYGLSFAMTGSLLALNFGASAPAPLAEQILPELREALRQLIEALRGSNFGIRQELLAEAHLMSQMVRGEMTEIEQCAVLLLLKSLNLGSFIDRDSVARDEGRHDDDLLKAEHLALLKRVVRASAPFVREFPEARKLDDAHRERKFDAFDPDRLFDVIERAVQAFVLEAEAAGVLSQAVKIAKGPGDEAVRARTVVGVSEDNFWSIVARAALNYGTYAALVAGGAAVMVTEGALNKVGSDVADHYRLSHSAVNLLQTIPEALLRTEDRPEDVKPLLEEAKASARGTVLPPIPPRRPSPSEAPMPMKKP